MKWFEDFFTKSKLMIVSGVLSVVGFGFLAVDCLLSSTPLFANYIILATLPAILLVCYKKGETSCQKALAGAILGIFVYAYWNIMMGGNVSSAPVPSIAYLELFMTIFLTIIFINHILLQLDHKGDVKVIKISQIVLVIAIVLQFIELMNQIINKQMYYDVINSFSLLASVAMITCMESRIQKYKARRSKAMANGTWTEEERQKSKKIFKF